MSKLDESIESIDDGDLDNDGNDKNWEPAKKSSKTNTEAKTDTEAINILCISHNPDLPTSNFTPLSEVKGEGTVEDKVKHILDVKNQRLREPFKSSY